MTTKSVATTDQLESPDPRSPDAHARQGSSQPKVRTNLKAGATKHPAKVTVPDLKLG